MKQTFSRAPKDQVFSSIFPNRYRGVVVKWDIITCLSCISVLFNSVGSVKIEIKPVNPFDGSEREDTTTEKREAESLKDSSRWRETKREREGKALSDPQIVRDFLMGDHCLYGGTGWWKYEFCYGMFWCSVLTLYPKLNFKLRLIL